MTVDLSVLDAANKKLQADLSARQTTRAFASAVTAALHQMNPAPAPTPAPVPAGWVVAPPRTGATSHPYSTGINMNIQSSGGVYEDDHDFPDGSGDSTVLVGSGGRFVNGVTLRRFRLRKVAIGNTVSYGKHGFYLDAYNVLLEDLDVQCAAPAASCLSIRMGGTHVNRALLSGALPIGIFDSDTGQSDGTVLVENVHGTFPGDTGVWCDAQDDFKTTFDLKCTFRAVEFSGSGAFLKATRVRNGQFRFEGCRLNGNLLKPGDVPQGSVIA